VIRIDTARSNGLGSQPLFELVIKDRATVLVVSRLAQLDESVVAQAAAVHDAGVRVRTLTRFYEEWLGKLPLDELERISLMFDIGEIHRRRYNRIKRIIDVTVASVGMVVLGILMPFVLIGNLIANRGPLFYRQWRVGRKGDRFHILKFRTMEPQEDALANEWTSENDPRITAFGRILRRTHIDELPQVINVFRGDLSIVGPRPEQPQYVSFLLGRMPFYDIRHKIRPGLTGWAQVKYGYAGSETDALEKLQYDFFYLRNQGISLDLRIIGRTLRSVVRIRGR
jgi:lipopolysaccharide/colanic/teichoic acid biosynthesis glycosyltransferase